MSTTAKIILAISTTIAVIAGAYTLYWWVSKDSTQRQYDVNTQTQQYQAGLIAAERDRAQGFTVATDPGATREPEELILHRLPERGGTRTRRPRLSTQRHELPVIPQHPTEGDSPL